MAPAAAGGRRHPLQAREFWGLVKRSALAWNADSIPRFSAALSYYTFFSLAPLLVISIAVCGIFFGREAAEGRILEQIQSFVGRDSAQAIQTVLRSAWKPGTSLFAIIAGSLTLLVGATGVLNELKGALNLIWRVEAPKSFKLLLLNQTRLLGFVLGIGFLLVVSLIFSAVMMALASFFGGRLSSSAVLLALFNTAFDWLMTIVLFAAIFKWLPDTRIAWRDVFIGAIFTAFLFVLGRTALSLYLGKSAVTSVYGAAGSLIIILLWVYYSALIFYFGAEFTNVYAKSFGSRQ
jgi:membrane protein